MPTFTYDFSNIKIDTKYHIRDPKFGRFDEVYVEQKIAEAYVEIITSELWSFRATSADIVLTSNSSTFELPDDFDLTDTSKYYLYRDSIKTTNRMQYLMNGNIPDDSATGQPRYWWIYDNVANVYPIANNTYTLKLKYFKIAEQLDADNPIPIIPAQFASIIAYKAALLILPANDVNISKVQTLYQNKYNEMILRYFVQSEDNQQTEILPTSTSNPNFW